MIIFNSVTKSFGDDTPPALQDVSFEIAPGELVLLTGHSGSGKTTLMKLMTKEYLPTAGEIIFEDTPLSSIKHSHAYRVRRKIGVVFQDYRLLNDLTVWENIALALSIIHTNQAEIDQRVSDLLDLTGLNEKAYLFPQQLSGGEAQRVAIARALSTAPKVIFADEPTGNLDEDTSANIIELLQKINELGTTVMITTHDVTVKDILKGERNLRLEQGQVVNDTGTKKTVREVTQVEVELELDPVEDTDTTPVEAPQKPKSKKPRFSLSLPSFGGLFGKKQSATKNTQDDKKQDEKVHVEVEDINDE